MISGYGFFVKVSEKTYTGPYDNLNMARENARVIGPNQEIYHGTLQKKSDVVDDSLLFLVPKCQKV